MLAYGVVVSRNQRDQEGTRPPDLHNKQHVCDVPDDHSCAVIHLSVDQNAESRCEAIHRERGKMLA